MQALARRFYQEEEVHRYLDLVAVSIASDIFHIDGENRILAYHGLKKLNEDPTPGLKALRDAAGLQGEIDVSAVLFSIGPRINAAGRVAHGRAAVELMVASNDVAANELAERLNLKNEQRRQFDLEITKEAIAMIEENELLRAAKSTVLFKPHWHKGVIGIVAARCIERYYRPTVILTESNNKVTGSARSVRGFDLYNAILECSEYLEKFGGHKYAAGLTMDIVNVASFQQKFEEVVSSSITEEMMTPSLEIDVPLEFDYITPKFVSVLKQMAPFGPGNPRPVFKATNVFVFNALTSFKDKHVRFLARQEENERIFQAIGFDMADCYEQLASGDTFEMVYTVEENVYNGTTSVQLRIKDMKFEQ
jgi:single-stranded-DNA-specific exonuclease